MRLTEAAFGNVDAVADRFIWTLDKMAQRHLDELQAALSKHGWRLEEVLLGDDHSISGSWALVRNPNRYGRVVLDFDGMDELKVLPLVKSYACTLRGTGQSLYFRRRGLNGSAARQRWQRELEEFVAGIDRGNAA
jgi:hypothetical protein